MVALANRHVSFTLAEYLASRMGLGRSTITGMAKFWQWPAVIVEVLSRSTAQYDHGAKFQAYELLPSLRHYVLTEQDRAEVEVWSRNGPKDDWEAERHDQILDVAPLGAIGCLLKVEEIYERINF